MARFPMLNRAAQRPLGGALRGFLRKSFLEDFQALIPDARVMFDVGAHIGEFLHDFHVYLPEAVGHAFEPGHRSYKALEANMGGKPRVILNKMAVGEKSGVATFHDNVAPETSSLLPVEGGLAGEPSLQSHGNYEVEVTTIDDYMASRAIPRIDLLKMDIQGHELAALRGAERALEQRRIRLIYLEVTFVPLYQGQATVPEIITFMAARGYPLFDFYNFRYLENGQLREGDALFVSDDYALATALPKKPSFL